VAVAAKTVSCSLGNLQCRRSDGFRHFIESALFWQRCLTRYHKV